MIGSDLYKPLPGAPAKRHRAIPSRVAGVSVFILALGAVSVMAQRYDGNAGEPFAIGTVVLKPAPPVERVAAAEAAPAQLGPASPAISGDAVAPTRSQDVSIENGVTVVRGMASDASGPVTLRVPDLHPARASFKAPDRQLLEASPTGRCHASFAAACASP